MFKIALVTGAVLLSGVAALTTGTLSRGEAAIAPSEGAGFAQAENTTTHAQSTLWGIYGRHDVHDCPLNNRDTAKYVVEASKADIGPLLDKYGVTDVRDRYHSGLEHTFLWAVETTRPHELEEFAIELGIARWNDLTIVPLITFEEGVVPAVARLHGLD